ncbi:MAG: SDR family NAD(P)-dependent oxidoreductase [Candidatus Izemoplasmatales bacterium]
MKTIVVTGATDGIGRAAAEGFLKAGCRVVGVARNRKKAAAMEADLREARLSFQFADLSSVREVDALATRLAESCPDGIDALVHVAGTVSTHRELTVDGYEKTFAVNHLAVHHLTIRCLPLLERRPGARVLVVSSRAHRWGRIFFRDVSLRGFYWLLTAYAQSKLMNVLFVRDMARRIDPKLVSFYAIDPGLVDTGIVAKTTKGLERWIWSWRRKAGTPPSVPAAAMVRIALEDAYAGRSGLFWMEGVEKAPARRSGTVRTMDRLHALSDAMVDVALGGSSRFSAKK